MKKKGDEKKERRRKKTLPSTEATTKGERV